MQAKRVGYQHAMDHREGRWDDAGGLPKLHGMGRQEQELERVSAARFDITLPTRRRHSLLVRSSLLDVATRHTGRTLHLRCITDSAFNAEVAAAASIVHLVGSAPKDCVFKALGDYEKLPDLVNGRPSYAQRGAPDTVTRRIPSLPRLLPRLASAAPRFPSQQPRQFHLCRARFSSTTFLKLPFFGR